jgi:hypothetical protein
VQATTLLFWDSKIPAVLVSNNNPSASAVATDSAVGYVLASVGFPWVQDVAVVSSIV